MDTQYQFKSPKVSVVEGVSSLPFLCSPLKQMCLTRSCLCYQNILSAAIKKRVHLVRGKEQKGTSVVFLLQHLPLGTEWKLYGNSLIEEVHLIKNQKVDFQNGAFFF